MYILVGCKVVGTGSRFHGLGKNHVTVVVVDDKDVCVTVAGWDNETACWVGRYFAGDGFAGCEDVVGSD